MGILVIAVLVGCSSQHDSQTFDVVAKDGPTISSVTTADGFTQVRQSAEVVLVITGKRLGDTTSVSIGNFSVTLLSVTAREVRVTAFTVTSTPLGPVDVTVTSPAGSVTAPGAIELTPFVVSPTAVAGHGTFESPMNLCSNEFDFTDHGSVVLLLAGTHRCGRSINIAGGTVLGDPAGTTIVTGTAEGGFGFGASSSAPLTFRDLTFAPPLAEVSIAAGIVTVERVVDAGGIVARDFRGGFAKIDHYTYEGEGTAIQIDNGEITNSVVRHCGSGDGIVAQTSSSMSGNHVLIANVVVEDCQRGVVVAAPATSDNGISATISNAQLVDNVVGITSFHAAISANDVVIRDHESTPRAGLIGISIDSGDSVWTNVEITGQSQVGIRAGHRPSDNLEALVWLDGLSIVGGLVGIAFDGIDNQLLVRNSIVRDQTEASLRLSNIDGVGDLGSPASSGNNALSVVSGFAIDDVRFFETPGRYIRGTGLTLNGVSFAGQTIDGPATLAPHYRFIASETGIIF